jgi:hypothetical protein
MEAWKKYRLFCARTDAQARLRATRKMQILKGLESLIFVTRGRVTASDRVRVIG